MRTQVRSHHCFSIMAAVARTICQAVWNCSICVGKNCLFLISEDKSVGCFSSIVGRPKVTRQLETLQECGEMTKNETNGSESVGDYSNDLAEILGSGSAGIVLGVLVTVAVCYFLLRRRQQRQNADPENAEEGDDGGFRAGGNMSPGNIMRAAGNALRAGAMVSRVVRQISQLGHRQNDQVPLIPNEVVDVPAVLESPELQNQDEELGNRMEGRSRRAPRNYRPRDIFRAAGNGRGVATIVSAVFRRISHIARHRNQQVPLVHNEEAAGVENLAMQNLAGVGDRAPSPGTNQDRQNEPGRVDDQVNEPRQPLMDPDRRSPIRDLFEDGLEDAEMARILNSSQLVVMDSSTSSTTFANQSSVAAPDDDDDDDDENLSDTTDSTLVPGDDSDEDHPDDDSLSVTTESTVVSTDEFELSNVNNRIESLTGNQDIAVEQEEPEDNQTEENLEEIDLEDRSEAGPSFTIGSSESTPTRRVQPARASKDQSKEMIKALRKHNLL